MVALAMDADATSAKFLASLFSAEELRRWLRRLPGGEDLVGRIQPNLAPVQLFEDVADILERDGFLANPEFWARLIAVRPQRKADIERGRARFANITRPGSSPAQLTVLMVSASPDTHRRLRVDRGLAQVIARMRGTSQRDRLKIVQVQAASFDDLCTAMMEHRPHVLHISSHGQADGSLVFEAGPGGASEVPKRKLLRLLESLAEGLRLVVINACESAALARDIPPVIDLAVGMSDAIEDEAAIAFATTIYEALGFGKSVEVAFNTALAKLDERDEDVPLLFPPPTQDPSHRRRTVLLGPL